MTRSDLIGHLSETSKMPKGRTEQIVGAIFDSIEQALKLGDRVEIRGFGSFEVRSYEGYVGRNPRTGTTAVVKPKKLPFFKVGRDLRDRVNPSPRAEPAARAIATHTVAPRASDAPSTVAPASTIQAEATLGAS